MSLKFSISRTRCHCFWVSPSPYLIHVFVPSQQRHNGEEECRDPEGDDPDEDGPNPQLAVRAETLADDVVALVGDADDGPDGGEASDHRDEAVDFAS